MQQQACHRGGQEGDEQIQYETLFVPAADAGDQAPDAGAIVPDHAENRAELDDDFEDLAFFVVEIEQIAHDDQMAGGGDRQKFGQAFDNTENECLDQKSEFHARLFLVYVYVNESGRPCTPSRIFPRSNATCPPTMV